MQNLAKYSFDEFLSKYWDHIEKSILENNQRKKGSFYEILCEFSQFEKILFFGRFDIPNDLQKYFSLIDSIQPPFEESIAGEFCVGQNLLKLNLVRKFLSLEKYIDQTNWLRRIREYLLNTKVSAKEISVLICRSVGLVLLEIGDRYSFSRERARQIITFTIRAFEIKESELNETKALLKRKFNNYLLDSYMRILGRIPKERSFRKRYANNEFYREIIELSPVKRLLIYVDENIDIPKSEYDYHYELLNDGVGR